MDKITSLTECYGCGVCAVACPQLIINIKISSDGFYRPNVENKAECIHCNLCEKVCPCLDLKICNTNTKPLKGYSVESRNASVLKTSSSGGVAYELLKYYIENSGIVCAVEYNNSSNKAVHFIVDNLEKLGKSQGSKYIQSYTVDAFKEIIKVKSNLKVIIGSPCQIDALRRLIRIQRSEEDYLLIDFFCHGIPSLNLWKKYADLVKAKIGSISSINFRNKNLGWQNSYVIHAQSFNGDEWISAFSKGDLFYTFFLNDYVLNEPCYNCKFRCYNSSADVRIGDFWGPRYKNNSHGVSGVMAITKKGYDALINLADSCIFREEELEAVTEGQMKNGTATFIRTVS